MNIVHRTPKGGLRNAMCPKFEQAAITPKRYEIGCQLLLITIRKSHTGLRLVRTSMTLNGVIAHILFFFSWNSIALQADYVTVVDLKIDL